jgi:hypothetical protein
MEKYNRTEEEITNANEKMTKISELAPETPQFSVIRPEADTHENIEKNYKGGKIVTTKLSKEEYNEIWDAFAETEAEDFKTQMGYGKVTIKKIGLKAFIDFMGWRNIKDVSLWRSNAVHVIPCMHCKSAFTTFEIDYGLCPQCKQQYDMQRFFEMCAANEKVEPGSASALRIMFVYDNEFKNNYLKKSIEQRIKECVEVNFKGIDSLRLFRDLYADLINSKTVDEFINRTMNRKVPSEAQLELQRIMSIVDMAGDTETALKEIFLEEEAN